MLFSAVSVLVVAQSNSEIPERLMNNPVYYNTNRLQFAPVTVVFTFEVYRRFALES